MRSWTELDHVPMMPRAAVRTEGHAPVEEGDELDTIFRSSAATAPPAADVVHDHAGVDSTTRAAFASQLLRSFLRGRRSWVSLGSPDSHASGAKLPQRLCCKVCEVLFLCQVLLIWRSHLN